ncbi:hypothetical protein [Paracoccus aestuariivivens]|uniref:Cellulose biosynthesis protein BcsN n=1 Tax=Paracoccus aestuariivivens TaxID=1820333 RepID=A0A6L6JDE9_9RHOB|nr:hypothetical protein [Paracoccus aestuariivivens]MTH79208.1 hypothetical protein [Paracoccus aestuariivivens]
MPSAGRALAIARRIGSTITFGIVVAALSGCVMDSENLVLTQSQLEERTPFVPVSVGQAWVNAPGMRGVLERNLRVGAEQRISLVNTTTVQGDNVMMLRTRNGGMSSYGRLRFEDIVSRFGGLPYPFTNLTSGDLQVGDDGSGSYFWASQTLGGSVSCVLGLRRVDRGMRQLPGDAGVMDIVLRNCVNGSAQDALEPLFSNSIGVAPIASGSNGESRMLSPLAAPTAGLVAITPASGPSQ